MTLATGPNSGLLEYGLPGEPHYDSILNQWRWMDFFLNPNVKSMAVTAPPGSPANGDAYILPPAGVSGAWAGKGKQIARWTTRLTVPAWEFFIPKQGHALIYNLSDSRRYQYNGTVWEIFASGGGGSGGGGSGDLLMASSDMDTEITTGTDKSYVPASRDGTIKGIKANLLVASSVGDIAIDIKKNGTSILSTPLSIDATETSSLDAAVAAVISDDACLADDVYTVDITAAGSGAKGLIVTLLFEETPPVFTWNAQVANYTLDLTDANNGVAMNVGSANTLTVPPNSAQAFRVGDSILVEMAGAGTTTIAAGAGVTVNHRSATLDIAGQYGVIALTKKATNEWLATGDFT